MDFQDLTLLGPMASYHFDRSAGYNEQHPAIGLLSKNGWGGGVYKNSNNRTSVFAGKEFRYPINGLLDAAAQLGVVTGYEGGPVPAFLPGLIGKFGDHEVSGLLMPPSRKSGKGGVAFQYRKRLKD